MGTQIFAAAWSDLLCRSYRGRSLSPPRSLVALGVGLLLLGFPGAAFAEDDDPFDRPGFYLGLGGSYQYNVFENRLEDAVDDALGSRAVDVSLDLDDSGGLNAVVGYRAASFFAIELQYEWVSEYDVDVGATVNIPPPVEISTKLYSIEGHTLTANTKWIVPFWRVQPYLLLGGGLAVSDVDRGSVFDNAAVQAVLDSQGIDIDDGKHTKAAGRAALGVDVYLTQNILVNAGAGIVVTTLKDPDVGDIDDLNYMSFQAGLQYRF